MCIVFRSLHSPVVAQRLSSGGLVVIVNGPTAVRRTSNAGVSTGESIQGPYQAGRQTDGQTDAD